MNAGGAGHEYLKREKVLGDEYAICCKEDEKCWSSQSMGGLSKCEFCIGNERDLFFFTFCVTLEMRCYITPIATKYVFDGMTRVYYSCNTYG